MTDGIGAFRPGKITISVTKVEISVACKNLADKDIFSKSDPCCVLFIKEFATEDKWIEVGRTECIKNSLNPEFVRKFLVDYYFEERQMLKFEIYDVDNTSPNLAKQDFLGRYECSLGEIVGLISIQKLLSGPKIVKGNILVTVEELSSCKEEIEIQLMAKNLDSKDWCSKSDAYLAFYKVNEDLSETIVHRTEVMQNSRNPKWKPIILPIRVLCAGDKQRSLIIKAIDWNRDGKEKLIGQSTTNINELKRDGFILTLDRRDGKSGKKAEQKLIVVKCKIYPVATFMDYIKAGTELSCTMAIDFTASNGQPSGSNSLHYNYPQFPSLYARAISAVGYIIKDYDSDKLFPVLGFGARLPPNGQVSHEFFVNGSADNPYCAGIEGVIDAYNNCVTNVQLSGPTNFAPVINHEARFASEQRDGSKYFILLILTDGVITDMSQTKEAIVSASNLPMSIIIIGIGTADFGLMEELDADVFPLESKGVKSKRDIVQFVPFRDFMKGNSPQDLMVAQSRLAKCVLAELPNQLLSYMRSNKISPGAWRTGKGPSNKVSPSSGSADSL